MKDNVRSYNDLILVIDYVRLKCRKTVAENALILVVDTTEWQSYRMLLLNKVSVD